MLQAVRFVAAKKVIVMKTRKIVTNAASGGPIVIKLHQTVTIVALRRLFVIETGNIVTFSTLEGCIVM